jgi:hypothetical protein
MATAHSAQRRTLQAARQGFFAALTTPPLTYQIDAGPPQTLPIENVWRCEPVDVPEPKPDPLVCISVADAGRASLAIPMRNLDIALNISSALPGADDIVTELASAVVGLLESPDPSGAHPLSRAATAQTLPISIAQVRSSGISASRFDPVSQRWYVTASFHVVAL